MNYLCSAGHKITSVYPEERCRVIVRGCPCRGSLTEVGPNWGALKKREAVEHYGHEAQLAGKADA